MVKKIPDGYRTTTPYLFLKGAAQAIDFYKKAFGAEELMRMGAPGGTIGHAEIKIGDSIIMLSDESPEMGARSAATLGGCTSAILLYVEDVDTTFKRAVDAGATVNQAVEHKFYGDRAGAITDPFGQQWYIHTHVEDVNPEEMERRMAAMAG
jgi:PhnB protein